MNIDRILQDLNDNSLILTKKNEILNNQLSDIEEKKKNILQKQLYDIFPQADELIKHKADNALIFVMFHFPVYRYIKTLHNTILVLLKSSEGFPMIQELDGECIRYMREGSF